MVVLVPAGTVDGSTLHDSMTTGGGTGMKVAVAAGTSVSGTRVFVGTITVRTRVGVLEGCVAVGVRLAICVRVCDGV
jgi:hypothetical protein